MKKRKRHRGTEQRPARRAIIRARARGRAYPARAVAENYFSAASPLPGGNSYRICEYRMRVPFAGGRYRLILFFSPMSPRSHPTIARDTRPELVPFN